MRKFLGVLLGLGFVAVLLQGYAFDTTYAGNYANPEMQEGFRSEEYEQAVGKKLVRGTKNLFLGWLEIFHGVKTEIHHRRQEYLPIGVEATFIGIFRGTVNAVGRTGVGFYEVMTFPFYQGPILEEMEDWIY